jgi:hypothetical protein
VHAAQRPTASGEPETLLLRFDATPGAMHWQLVGGITAGQTGGQAKGALYMRGVLPAADAANRYDPTHAMWEVAVVPPGSGATTWVRASRLRFVRGVVGTHAAPHARKDEL